MKISEIILNRGLSKALVGKTVFYVLKNVQKTGIFEGMTLDSCVISGKEVVIDELHCNSFHQYSKELCSQLNKFGVVSREIYHKNCVYNKGILNECKKEILLKEISYIVQEEDNYRTAIGFRIIKERNWSELKKQKLAKPIVHSTVNRHGYQSTYQDSAELLRRRKDPNDITPRTEKGNLIADKINKFKDNKFTIKFRQHGPFSNCGLSLVGNQVRVSSGENHSYWYSLDEIVSLSFENQNLHWITDLSKYNVELLEGKTVEITTKDGTIYNNVLVKRVCLAVRDFWVVGYSDSENKYIPFDQIKKIGTSHSFLYPNFKITEPVNTRKYIGDFRINKNVYMILTDGISVFIKGEKIDIKCKNTLKEELSVFLENWNFYEN